MNANRWYARVAKWLVPTSTVAAILVLPAAVALAGAASVLMPDLVSQVAPQAAETSAERATRVLSLDLSKIFTYFFMMLGPLKVLGPFAKLTAGTDNGFRIKLAVSGCGFAGAIGTLAVVLGVNTLTKWDISLPALLTAGGIIFFLVALQAVLQQYEPVAPPAEPVAARPAPSLRLALAPLAVPTIMTPYGIGALILLIAASREPSRDLAIFGVFLGILLLDLLAMLFAHVILQPVVATVLGITGSVFGILQAALAVQLVFTAGVLLGVIPPLGR